MCIWVIRRVISMLISMDRRSFMEPGSTTIRGSTDSIIRGPGPGVLASATIPMWVGRSVLDMALAGSMAAGVQAGVVVGVAGAAAGGARRLIIRLMPGTGIVRRASMARDLPATGMSLSTVIIRISMRAD